MSVNGRIVTAVMACALAHAPFAASAQQHWRVYIGTYTGGESEGIYLLDFDAETGRLDNLRLAATIDNPSFVALHPSEPRLYAVGARTDEDGERRDSVTAFSIDEATGMLTELNSESSMGRGPCHVTVHPAGRYAAVANYGGGSIAALPILEDGSLGEASAFVQHEGSSVHRRQQQAHAHSVTFDEAGRFLFAADLGIDKIMIYRFDASGGTLEANEPHADLAPGAGPRHFAFHPSGDYAYAINELDNTVTAFAYDAATGRLDTIHTVPTLPEDFTEDNTTAEVRVHPSGRFVYGSNRGHDSIAVFGVDPETGRLEPRGWTSTQGNTPRNFNLDPTGGFLIAANQQTDTLVVFRVDPEAGTLEPTGQIVDVPTPVCVAFAAPPQE